MFIGVDGVCKITFFLIFAPKRIIVIMNNKPLGFWKTMLASATGFIAAFVVINIVGLLLMILLVTSIATSGKNGATPIVGNHIFLKIDLSQGVSERTPDELYSFLSGFSDGNTVAMCDMLSAIKSAANDERIEGIYIYTGATSTLSWAQSDELRDALSRFRATSGKPVVAYADFYPQSGYYLATSADRIFLHPAGMVDFRGIGAEVIYYKDFLDKLGVTVDLIRPSNNAYKSAGESYISNKMSDANREQIRGYINGIWEHVVEGVSKSRNIEPERLNGIADIFSGYMASDSREQGLVDSLLFERDLHALLRDEYGCKRIVDASKYAHSLKSTTDANRIAVIYAEGNVVDGKSNGYSTQVYSEDIVEALNDATNDEKVKAIVLRVNSPGGAVTASEAMTNAVMLAKKKKPVVVSMSSLAASAGYEISCNATTIVAQPTTLTGSIGVFAAIPEAGKLMRERLGIKSDTVCTNRNSTAMSMMRPLSPTARAMMQRTVEEFYHTFCSRVAQGRKMSVEAIDSIARGRVWTGKQAQSIGLVDTLGGMELAIELAAKAAGIKSYSTIDYPKRKDLLTRIMNSSEERQDILLRKNLKTVIPGIDELIYWSEMSGLQARLPFILTTM